MTTKLDRAYQKWLASCLKKYNKKTGEDRKYTSNPDGEYPHDQVVEFDDEGNAYVYSPTGGVKQIENVNTPWISSRIYLKYMSGV